MMSSEKQRSPLLRLFPVLLLNVVELGIALPVLPALALALGGDAIDVGLLYTLQSFGQFVMAPLWGALSDRFGRKNVLIATFVLAALAEVLTAFAPTLLALYAARLFVGLCAGNVATASALIADVTDESNRSKGMALVGISFGLGFTLGPAIGALISWQAADTVGIWGLGAPFMAAGILSLFTAVLGVFLLIEPLGNAEEREKNRAHRPSFRTMLAMTRRPELASMFWLFFFYTIAASIMESTFFLFMEAEHGYKEEHVGMVFAALGILMATVQGSVGRVSKRVGDGRMTTWGGLAVGAGLFAAGFAHWLPLFFGVIALSTIGRAFIHPGILSLTSKYAKSSSETGTVMGVLQSFSSLGRIAGPAVGGFAFQYISHASPFWIAGATMIAAVIVWTLGRKNPPE